MNSSRSYWRRTLTRRTFLKERVIGGKAHCGGTVAKRNEATAIANLWNSGLIA